MQFCQVKWHSDSTHNNCLITKWFNLSCNLLTYSGSEKDKLDFDQMIANFPPMDTLELTRIEKGKRLLLISLVLLALLRLMLAIMLEIIVEETVAFDQFNEVYWWMIPVLALMGAAVFRGGKAVRYILCGLLVVALVLEVYLFALAGFPDTVFMIVSILAWVSTLFLLYVVMLNNETEEFFLYQRSRNFGEYAVVRNEEVQNAAAGDNQAKRKPKQKKTVAAMPLDEEEETEAEDYLEQDRNSASPKPGKKKKKGEKKDWDDELDLFE